MPPTPEYVEAEKRRKANRERARLNPPKLTQPVEIPDYAGTWSIRNLVGICAVGCGLAAVICLVAYGAYGFVFAALFGCFCVWGCALACVLTLLMDIACDSRMTRAMTRRIMELIEHQCRKDLPPKPPPTARKSGPA